MAAASAAQLEEIIEALRAVRDADTNLQGLKSFRRQLRQDGEAFLQAYLAAAPGFAELHRIWDHQHVARNAGITTMLLRGVGEVLARTTSDAAVSSELDALACSITGKRLKGIYRHLGASDRAEANLALDVLTAIAARGPATAGVLLHDFDCEHEVLGKLAKPVKSSKCDAGTADADLRKQPVCVAYARFLVAMLRNCHAAERARFLSLRTPINALFQTFPGLPPALLADALAAVRDKVLAPVAGLPPPVQASAFGDSGLMQLAALAARDAEDADADAPEASATMAAVSQTAYDMLLQLATDPRHGLAEAHPAATSVDAGSPQSGRRRLLRMLQHLQARSVPRHAQLLLAVCRASPQLASAFLAACSWPLEPQPSVQWLTGVTLLGQLSTAAAAAQPLQLATFAARGLPPPAFEGATVRALLRCIIPPPLTKAALSHGLQHEIALVRYVTLCALCTACSALQPLLAELSAATDLATAADAAEGASRHAGSGAGGIAAADVAAAAAAASTAAAVRHGSRRGAWVAWGGRLTAWLRGRLPEPQVLMALHAAMEAQEAHMAGAGVQADAVSGSPAAGSEADNAAELPNAEGADAEEKADEQVPALDGDASLGSLNLLATIAAYQRCLPGAMADARIDISRLVPADPLLLSVPRQQALVEALAAAAAPLGPSSSAIGSGAAINWAAGGIAPGLSRSASGAALAAVPLLPLLQLASGSPSAGVRTVACNVAASKLEASGATDGFGCTSGEAALWLGMLPQLRADSPAQQTCVAAIHSFLAEAVAITVRRPYESLEQVQQLLSGTQLAEVRSAGTGFSGLAVTVLRRVLRVAASAKMAPDAKTAVAGYAAGVLCGILRLQAHAAPFAEVCRHILEDSPLLSCSGDGAEGHAAAAEAQPLLSLHHLALAALGAGPEDGSPPPAKRRKNRHGAAAAAETSDAGTGAMLLSSLQSCGDRLQFAQALLRAPRRTLQDVLGDAAAMCSQQFSGDQAPVFGAAAAHGLELLAAGAPLLMALAALCQSEDLWDLPTTAAAIDQWVERSAAKPLVARAAAAALTHATSPQIIKGLFSLLRRCLQVPAESDEPQLRAATDALSAVLPQPSLQQGFLAAADPVGLSAETVKLVAEVLQAAEAAGRGAGASAGSAALWAVTARRLCQPYIAKLERVLEAASAGCAPATLQAAAALSHHISCSALAFTAARALGGCDGKDEDHAALALQLAHAVMRHSAAIGHAAPDASAPGHRDHEGPKDPASHGAAVVRAAAQLLLRSQPPAAEAALAAWLAAPPPALLTQPSRWLAAEAPPLLELCMRRSTPAAGAIAAVLVDQLPDCRARFRVLLTSGSAQESLPGQQQSPLALLPAAAAYMEHGLQAGSCDKGPAAVAAALQQPVLEHIVTGNLHVPGSSAAARLAADAAAVSAAVAALRIAPPSAEGRRRLLQELVPAGGWLLGHSAAADAKAATEAALLAAARQAACAAAIVYELPQEEAGAALQETVVLALAASETLQALYAVPRQSSLQQQLEAMLTGLLGGALAQRLHQAFRPSSDGLPSGGTPSASVPGAAAGLLGAVDGLASATLRHRLAAPPALAMLRRLLEVLTAAAGFKSWEGRTSAAALTAKHFELLMAHSRLPALLLAPGSDAAAALPAPAEAAVAPLASLLPLADGLLLLLPQGAAPSEAAQQKESVAELAASLLQAHAAASCASESRTADTVAFAGSAAAALPLLLAAYGATMSYADRMLLAAIRTIDRLTAAGSDNGVSQLLASTGYLWGATALEAHRRKLLIPLAADGSDGGNCTPSKQRGANGSWPAATGSMNAPAAAAGKMSNTADSAADQRQQAVQRLLAEVPPVDVRRAALAAVAPRHPAAHDPSFVMPFAAQVLQSRVMNLETFSSSGLLAMCLASLSAEDPSVRAHAAGALQVLSAALDDPASLPKRLQPLAPLVPILHTALAPEPATSIAATGSETAAAAEAADAESSHTAAASDPEDAAMHEADAGGNAVGPFSGVSGQSRAPRRLPAITALLLAEAATQLAAPAAGMARRLGRLLSSRPDLDLEELPLLHAELTGGTPRHAADRAWLLRLLAAGLQGQQDFQVYRKRFVLELLMAVQDSPVADGEAKSLALGTLCRAARIPAAARDLATHAGFIPWLAVAAAAATGAALQAEGHAAATAPWSATSTASAAVLAAADTVNALTALVYDPAVAKQLERSAQADQAADAARALCRVLCTGSAAGRGEQTSGAVLLWRSVLRLLVAALHVTEDRRHRGFTGAVLQVRELAQLLRLAPSGPPVVGAVAAEDHSGPAAAAAAGGADVQQVLVDVLLLTLPREAVGAAASPAGSSGAGGQADDVTESDRSGTGWAGGPAAARADAGAFRNVADWAAAAAAACRPHRWASLSAAATDAGASVSAAITAAAAAIPQLSQLLPLGLRSDGGRLQCDEAVAAGLPAWLAACATAPAVELS